MSPIVTDQPNATLAIRAVNFTGYGIQNPALADRAPVTYTDYLTTDTTLSIPLDSGQNLVTIRFVNAQDTQYVCRWLYHAPPSQFASQTHTVALQGGTPLTGAAIYVDGGLYTENYDGQTPIYTTLGHHTIGVYRMGYQPYKAPIQSDTALSIQLVPKTVAPLAAAFNFQQDSVLYAIGITAQSSRSSRFQARSSDFGTNALGVAPLSALYTFKGAQSRPLKVGTVLDLPVALDTSQLYVLVYHHGQWHKQFPDAFGDSIEVETAVQKLLYASTQVDSLSLGLMQRLAPQVLQPPTLGGAVLTAGDSLVLPLGQFVRDPDQLPNDLSVAVGHFDSTKIAVYRRGNHLVVRALANAALGNASFELRFEHDRIVAQSTHTITVGLPLPIELLHFEAQKGNAALTSYLHWATATELNSSHFELEWSTDAIQFEPIGTVPAKGTATPTNTYQYWHQTPKIGVNYYRLKCMDQDGNFKYTATRQVTFEDQWKTVTVFPNPTTSDATLVLEALNEPAVLELYNPLGQIVWRKPLPPATTQTNIQLSDLAAGIYLLRLETQHTANRAKIFRLEKL